MHTCQLKLKAISDRGFAHPCRPHPLTPSPTGEGELNLWLPSPKGRGAGGEGKTLSQSGFHVRLTPMTAVLPLLWSIQLQIALAFFKQNLAY
ncbi:hypothetical protein A6S26_29390 [Nostoc sp. ATCC 43529]|nr:hypothetical protein A6S26_29390 [Nostoc sp. ATCC 43529]